VTVPLLNLSDRVLLFSKSFTSVPSLPPQGRLAYPDTRMVLILIGPDGGLIVSPGRKILGLRAFVAPGDLENLTPGQFFGFRTDLTRFPAELSFAHPGRYKLKVALNFVAADWYEKEQRQHEMALPQTLAWLRQEERENVLLYRGTAVSEEMEFVVAPAPAHP
jgi:hypothetical protein